ncbi:MAG: hypothetical protein IOB85_00835 [Methylobacterium sp.]|nr:hypothetical protein [Methylobacterium sp.]MCA3656116.1 hypothetical protein [Methylobacterium sp.]MCA3666502.1 hypothetical protein [Methylobacterium sp.]MCA3669266.1 hypothetical protein [Methylobacterium sp.]MCA3671694.1 hypothetical protein [Methylobacterium sp.]
MIYLIGQFWLWLLAAFVLGLAVGWFTFRGRDGMFWRGLIPWAMLLGVGALVAASRVFRDGPGFWVDLGMLLTGCYFIGCFLGDLWKGRMAEETAPAVARADPVVPVPAPPPVSVPLPAAEPVSARPKELAVEPMMVDAEPAAEAIEQAITGLSLPRGGRPDDLTRIFGIDPETERKLNALGLYHFDQIAALTAGQRRWLFRQLGFEGRFPSWWWRWKHEAQQILGRAAAAQPAASAGAPAEPVHAGVKPQGLEAPREGRADDLKRIRGIGRQNEARLHALGIWHFDQIAGWSAEEMQWVGSHLAFPGRIEREDWVGQARQLATGAETEFSKRVAKGLVPSSADDGDKGRDNVAKPGQPVKPPPYKKG